MWDFAFFQFPATDIDSAASSDVQQNASSPVELSQVISSLQKERDEFRSQAEALTGRLEATHGELEAVRGVKEAELYELKREVTALKEELCIAWSQVGWCELQKNLKNSAGWWKG